MGQNSDLKPSRPYIYNVRGKKGSKSAQKFYRKFTTSFKRLVIGLFYNKHIEGNPLRGIFLTKLAYVGVSYANSFY